VNDFRKIAGFECYAPTDNVSELTARTNDEGWSSVFAEWLRGSRLNDRDAVFVLSVGGGNLEKNVSPNLVLALQHAQSVGSTIRTWPRRWLDRTGRQRLLHRACRQPSERDSALGSVPGGHLAFAGIPPETEGPRDEVGKHAVEERAGEWASGRMGDGQRRAVFLDRDGVINRPLVRDGLPYPPQSWDEFELLPGVVAACANLKRAGYLLIVATNQPDVGRGTLSADAIKTIHQKMQEELPLDEVLACFHAGEASANPVSAEKGKAGDVLQAAKNWNIDLAHSFMVGDRWRDVDCGVAAGCRTIFIDWGYAEPLKQQPDFRAADLAAAAQIILSLS
jgi:D-glycero-D-manno-heptose 1,7-bisphosphate phosphatase